MEINMAAESETIIALSQSAGCDNDTRTTYVAVPAPLHYMLSTFVQDGTVNDQDDRFQSIAELLLLWKSRKATLVERTNIAFTVAQQFGRQITITQFAYTLDL
jgi:hypothetical protein